MGVASVSLADKKAYLKKRSDILRALPLFVARRAAQLTFTRVVELNVQKGFDSGQAAANWRLEGFAGTPSYEPQKMMWGYDDVEPIAPVGYKSYYEGYDPNLHLGGKGDIGDPDQVLSYQISYASQQITFMGKDVTTISVYNPISEGFAGFSPGNDQHYEENAFSNVDSKLISIADESLAQAESETSAKLRSGNADFS